MLAQIATQVLVALQYSPVPQVPQSTELSEPQFMPTHAGSQWKSVLQYVLPVHVPQATS
jgi:hypothetical protein